MTTKRLAWFALVALVGGNLFLGSASTVRAGGQFAVTDGGTAAYSYPIAVPPGIAGMAPKLSLSYSGNGINGPVGLGWSVQGLSVISRCPATIATDGAFRGVSFGPTDKLCLDGQRLIQTDANDAPLTTQTDDARGLATGSREYRTEKDTYARIRAYGIANGADTNGPAYFKVWTKSGQIYEYGAGPSANVSTQALINAQGKSVAAVWAVARISDTVGNYIDFKYEQRDVNWGSGPTAAGAPGHEWNILEIQYTGSTGQGQVPSNKIIFSYVDRLEVRDRAETYHQGSKNVSVRLLQAVRTYVNSPNPPTPTGLGPGAAAIKVRTTTLAYMSGPITGRSRLNSITECTGSAESSCLPATTFTYAPGGNDAYVVNTNFSSGMNALPMTSTTGNFGVILGDFNGDGKTDIIRWSDNPAENRLYLSNGDGSFTLSGSFNITDANLFKSDGCYISMVADFNGDGISDILRYSGSFTADGLTSCASSGPSAGFRYLYLGKGDGSFNRTDITTLALLLLRSKPTFGCFQTDGHGHCTEPDDSKRGWTGGSTFYLLDVDGDGIVDIVTASLTAQDPVDTPPPQSGTTRVLKGSRDVEGTFAPIPTNVANTLLYSDPTGGFALGQPSKTADVDGDGFTDIVVAGGWRSLGDGNFDPFSTFVAGCGLPIDFNGDGRNDCLFAGSPGSLKYSDGVAMTTVGGFNLTAPGQLSGSTIGDFNGDGRQDILTWKNDPAGNALYLSNGDGTFTQSPSFSLPAGDNDLKNSDLSIPIDFTLGDFTGRGTVEILRLKNLAGGGTSNRLLVKADPTPPDQLISVTSSTGLTTRLSYAPLSNAGGRYTSDRDALNTRIYPKVHLTPPSYVVTTSTTDSGVGTGTVSTDYSYVGLKANWGRGLLGFREIHRQAPGPNGDNLTVMTQYLQDHPYIGVASRTDTRRGTVNDSNAQLLSSSTFVYCDQTAAAGAETSATLTAPCTTTSLVQRPYLYQSVETGLDLSGAALPTVSTTNAFNGSGDPRSITVATTGTAAGVSQTFTKTTTNTYFADNTAGDNWIRGRLQRANVQNTVPNSLGVISTSAGTAPNATATTGTSLSISPSAPSASRNNPGAISTTATAVILDGQAPFTYNWTRLSGSRITVANATSATATFSATLGWSENLQESFQVTVTDSGGQLRTASVTVTFTSPPAPTVSVSPNPLTISSSTNGGTASGSATASAAGGMPPFTYSWSRLTGSLISFSGAQTATFSASVVYSDNYTESFRVTATDSGGFTATSDVNVTAVGPTPPPAPTVTTTPASPLSNSVVGTKTVSRSITANVAGGLSPFAYSWSVVSPGPWGTSITNPQSQTPTLSQTVLACDISNATFRVTVTDSLNRSSSTDVNWTVRSTGTTTGDCP